MLGQLEETPYPEDPAREAHITKWCERIKKAVKHHEPAFNRMREDMDLARTGCKKSDLENDDYTVPLIRRHLRQAVDRTFARLPKAYASIRPRLDYVLWDGQEASLQQAMLSTTSALQTGMMPDPNTTALLQEIQMVQQHKQMLQKAGDTLAYLFNYFIEEPRPSFKKQMKALLRRARTCAVAYIEIGFQRQMGRDPDIAGKLDDAQQQIRRLEILQEKAAKEDIGETDAELEELRQSIATLQQQVEVVIREGVVFDYPRSTEVIIDPACSQLDGFIHAGWIARERYLKADKIKEIYGKDVGENARGYSSTKAWTDDVRGEKAEEHCYRRVWQVQNIEDRQTFVICDGYCDYLRPPGPPDVEVEGFWTIFPLVMGDVEHEDELFPPSEVRSLMHPQREYNQARQGLREHRYANRPAYASRKGLLDEEDKKRLQDRPAHAVIELNAMHEQDSVDKVLQRLQPVPIDPAMYDTTPQIDDIFRGAGTQEAVMGGASGATATEVAVGENAMSAGSASDVDDIDEFLIEIARAFAQVALMNMSIEQVQEIVGPGAVWPEVNREQIVKELALTIKAGSTGRPNKAAELANHERAMPWLVQFPGVNPRPIAKNYLELLDIDTDEALVEGLPSIVAMNSMAGQGPQPGTGDPETDPNAQGDEGGDNAEQPMENEPGGQPAFPAAGPGMAGR